jgi:hypothetical protein
MNLRPDEVAEQIEEENNTQEINTVKEAHVKTSISLPRALAVRARRYVNAQQLAHAQGQRQQSYSFSQLYNDALAFYLEHFEKGDTHEKIS